MTIPDTVVVKAVIELVLDVDDELLFHHSRRVYLWGMLKSRRLGHSPAAECALVAIFGDFPPSGHTRRCSSDGDANARGRTPARWDGELYWHEAATSVSEEFL